MFCTAIITIIIIMIKDVPEMILVGNKSDIWQERQVVTDKACQVILVMNMMIILITMMIAMMMMVIVLLVIMLMMMMIIVLIALMMLKLKNG